MNYFWAFCVGGAICVAGQLLIDLTGLTPARILTGYVVAGVVLSAIGWYAPLAEFAGCGALIIHNIASHKILNIYFLWTWPFQINCGIIFLKIRKSCVCIYIFPN